MVQSLAEVPAAAWDACAGGTPDCGGGFDAEVKLTPEDNSSPQLSTRGHPNNPFVSHDFLSSLEASNSVGSRSGWQPRHLLAEDDSGTLLGAAPCYVKSHSRGEYVFDHGWAEAFERAGGAYYPKLQVAVPFTPVTGPRLLARPGPLADAVRGGLADALAEITTANDLSSAHVTFLTEPEWRLLGERGFLQRTDQQFHWENAGYATFDDFLAALASRKRKTIRRERKEALGARHRGALAHRRRPDRRGVGRLLRLLHGDRLAQMGPALSHPRLLLDRQREDGRPHPPGDGAARRALDRRRAQLHRRRHALRPQLGRHRAPPVPAFRAVLLPGHRLSRSRTSSSGWKPARKASTSSRAAICRRPPIPPISSPIRRCGGRSPNIWRASARYVEAAREELAGYAPFRKDLVEQE